MDPETACRASGFSNCSTGDLGVSAGTALGISYCLCLVIWGLAAARMKTAGSQSSKFPGIVRFVLSGSLICVLSVAAVLKFGSRAGELLYVAGKLLATSSPALWVVSFHPQLLSQGIHWVMIICLVIGGLTFPLYGIGVLLFPALALYNAAVFSLLFTSLRFLKAREVGD